MKKILVTGRMTLPSLNDALYAEWEVERYTHINGNCVAVITSESGNAEFMAGRLSSFNNVGVRTEWTENDMAESLKLLRSA
jgi:hypothetical protein